MLLLLLLLQRTAGRNLRTGHHQMCLQVLPGDLLEMTFLWSHTELPIQKLRAGEAKQGVL